MKKIIILLFLLLTACDEDMLNQMDKYSLENKPRAESGELLWSDYYKTLYDMSMQINIQGFYEVQSVIAKMIDYAQAFENGSISKEQFDSSRRMANVDINKAMENIERLRQQKLREYDEKAERERLARERASNQQIETMQNNTLRPISNSTLNCTSTKIGNTVNTNCY